MAERLSVSYGAHDIDVTIVRRPRKTLEIAVEPDATVVVTAPLAASLNAIAAKVRKRAGWVRRQQRFFAQYLPRTPERQFVPGETHLYLGRQYRLKVSLGIQASVKLLQGFLVVQSHYPDRPELTRDLVAAWYRSRALLKFRERLKICLERFGNEEAFRPRGIIVRQIRMRWGSMSPAGRLLLNTRLIEVPVHAIDYVITHELCHLREAHHGPSFFNLLERAMPDWQERKEQLELFLA
jgi:predicted metal-dependent hydrolase